MAPLAGWTDTVFRRLCKRFGASVVYSEMVSAEGIIFRQKKTLAMCSFTNAERPIGIQLFGFEPQRMAAAATWIAEQQPDFIDLNFACPVPKVVKRGAGAALLCEPERMHAIVTAVRRAVSIPLSAKIRMGWQQNNALQIGKVLQDAGINAIAIHPRTRQMGFAGSADWRIIADLKSRLHIPIIGNGDIRSPQDARAMIEQCGCDAVMVGRAAMGNPWIFRRIRAFLQDATVLPGPGYEEKIEVCLQHIESAIDWYGERRAIRLMRKHISKYFNGLPHISDFRPQFFACRSAGALLQRINAFGDLLGTCNEC